MRRARLTTLLIAGVLVLTAAGVFFLSDHAPMQKREVRPDILSGRWELIGPGGGGRITAITTDPSNPQNVYITINVGGARRSQDSGQTWEIINRGFDYVNQGENAQRLADIAVHPARGNLLLAGGLNGTIYESSDSGEEWRVSYRHPAKQAVDFSKFAFDPSNPDVVYIGVGSIQRLILGVGARRSEDFWPRLREGPTIIRGRRADDGWKWEPVGSIAGETRAARGALFNVYSVAINSVSPDELFAMTERGLWRGVMEKDGTVRQFDPINEGLPTAEAMHGGKIIFDPHNRGTAYLSVLNLGIKQKEESLGGVFKSMDGGRTWQKLAGGLNQAHGNYFDLALDPKNPDTIYAAQFHNEITRARGNLHRSQDNGKT